MHTTKLTLVLSATALLGACHSATQTGQNTTPQSPTPGVEQAEQADNSGQNPDAGNGDVVAPDDAQVGTQVGTEPLVRPAMDDEALGRLITSISEDTGDFPSDNFISNETSYLDVAGTLLDESRQGRAYVGVGPEQNLTYIALMRPEMAYIIDIRRENLLEHMVLRAAIEEAPDRATFLERLTSRAPPPLDASRAKAPTLDDLFTRVAVTRPQPKLVKQSISDTVALMKRLGIVLSEDDRTSIHTIVEAFANKGVDITYSMEGSKRRYPKLREILSATDLEGTQRSFMATEESYAFVRSLMKANRVVPVVGDFCGEQALKGIAEDVHSRGLQLGAFYTSNVEQYLFKAKCYDRFVENVKAFPFDDSSVFIRVWFDQGRRHPKQRPGHRTTSVVIPITSFMKRYENGAYRNYWRVVIDEPDLGKAP